jgi:hypothetical protein
MKLKYSENYNGPKYPKLFEEDEFKELSAHRVNSDYDINNEIIKKRLNSIVFGNTSFSHYFTHYKVIKKEENLRKIIDYMDLDYDSFYDDTYVFFDRNDVDNYFSKKNTETGEFEILILKYLPQSLLIIDFTNQFKDSKIRKEFNNTVKKKVMEKKLTNK